MPKTTLIPTKEQAGTSRKTVAKKTMNISKTAKKSTRVVKSVSAKSGAKKAQVNKIAKRNTLQTETKRVAKKKTVGESTGK